MDDKARNRVLLVLFIGVLMGALDIAIVAPALPTIRDYFGVDDRAAAWIFSIYVLFNLVSTPLMAKLSDSFGRRTIYVMDVAIFAAGSLVVAFAPAFAFVLIGRAIQGLGAGGIFPVASAVIGDTFPPEKRGRALGLIGAVFGLAFIIGPILGGVLLMAGWRWLFLINLPVAAAVIVMALRVLPTARRSERLRFDWLGMITLGVALASLAFGLNRIDTQAFGTSITTVQVWPFLLFALMLFAAFYFIEHRAVDPIVRPHLLGNGQLRLANVMSAGAGLGESGLVFIPALGYRGLRDVELNFQLYADAGCPGDGGRFAAGRPLPGQGRIEGRDHGGHDGAGGRHAAAEPFRSQPAALYHFRGVDRAGVVRAAGRADALHRAERSPGRGSRLSAGRVDRLHRCRAVDQRRVDRRSGSFGGRRCGRLQLSLSDHRARFGRVDRAVVRLEGAGSGTGDGAGEYGPG